MKLGKSSPVADHRTLKFDKYLSSEMLNKYPPSCYYGQSISPSDWGMMANDKVNNCTCAAAGHLIMEWTSDNGALFRPADDTIIHAYTALSGYNPATGANNNSIAALDVLNYWRKTGIAGHKIFAFTALSPNNRKHLMSALYSFGGCFTGLSLPLSARQQEVWSVLPSTNADSTKPGSWGGHAVAVTGYDPEGLTVVTWGITKKMTWEFWDVYCDEAFAIISTDFAPSGKAPNGFDINTLGADLKELSK